MSSESELEKSLLERLSLDGRPGPARPLSAADSAALVRRALDEEFAQPSSRRAPSALRRWYALVATAAFFALAGAATAAYVAHRHFTSPTVAPAPVKANAAPSAALPMVPSAPTPVALPAPAVAPPVSSSPPQPHTARIAVDALKRANHLRAEHRWRDAERAYEEIVRAVPDGDDATAAAVAAASLRLEHLSDPRGALGLFKKGLRGGGSGPLAEEAHYGIALAHRALDEKEAETRALELFLREHSDSVLLPKVQERLKSLGAL
jgi:hypothetical protein